MDGVVRFARDEFYDRHDCIMLELGLIYSISGAQDVRAVCEAPRARWSSLTTKWFIETLRGSHLRRGYYNILFFFVAENGSGP